MESALSLDFAEAPFLAVWEITRDCDLTCDYCPTRTIPPPAGDELTTAEGFALLRAFAKMGTRFCMLSGGDPAKRDDLSRLVRYGSEVGLSMVTLLAATKLVDETLVRRLRGSGLVQLGLNLDGPREDVHDAVHQRGGAFLRTLQCATYADDVDLPLQINTLFTGDNFRHFDAMGALVSSLRPVTWEVYLMVPIPSTHEVAPMKVEQVETFLARLAELSHGVDFEIKVSEAPQYCRYLVPGMRAVRSDLDELYWTPTRPTRALDASARRDDSWSPIRRLARTKVNAGNGLIFVDSSGNIYPSELLQIACGNVCRDSLPRVYRDHPTFRDLRDPDELKGKCGVCEYRNICGGSRARAYAITGDYLAEEPLCSYEPAQV